MSRVASAANAKSTRARPWHTALTLGAVCFVAIAPLLRGATPCTHDGGLHYYRVVAMRRAVKDGLCFTRYLPDLAFGYGYPFFNYREPLSYYVTLALHVAGVGLPLALNLIYVLSTLGCAAGAYLLARDLFGPVSGLVAAVAYAYAPYLFLDSLLRGNAPESLALALIPFVFWSFWRLAVHGGRRFFLLSAILLAALYLTHYISSLILAPALVLFLGSLWMVRRRRFHWVATAGALALAFGLAAALVLPALLEQGYVQLHMSRVTRNNDFHYNFVGLHEILSPPRGVDVSLVNPPMRIHLGLLQVTLAAAGVVFATLWIDSGEARVSVGFFVLLAVAFVWMSTAASLWAWETLPLLPFVQFPWRFVGRATLPVALLASVPFSDRLRPRFRVPHVVRAVGLAAAVFALIAAAYTSTFPPFGYCPSDPYPGVEQVFAYERETELVGVDPEGSYFPVWVKRRPSSSPLVADYAARKPVSRFDESSLPEGGRIVEAEYGPNRARIVLETARGFQATYQVFYFPGWRVQVDSQRVAAGPTEPDGLLTFAVPGGRHTVEIQFVETPLRLGADLLSLGSLLGVLVIALRRPDSCRSPRGGRARPDVGVPGPTLAALGVVAAAAVIALALKLLVVDRTNTLFRFSRQPTTAVDRVAAHPLDLQYANGLHLIGYDQTCDSIAADEALRLDLYWTSHTRPSTDFQSVIHLVGRDGLRWSKPDSFRPRGYAAYPPATSWRADHYAIDSHEVEPVFAAPPGVYDIVLTAFDRRTLAPISVLDDRGQPTAPELVLGTVTVMRPDASAQPDESLPVEPLLSFGGVELAQAHLDRSAATSGDAVLLTTLWRAADAPEAGLKARVTLNPTAGVATAAHTIPLSAPWWPTEQWAPGDVWRGQTTLRLPATLESDDYRLAIAVPPSGPERILPATVRVEQPQRSFDRPETDVELREELGGVAALVGYSVSPTAVEPGGVLTVMLAWQALGTPVDSLHVFVHLLSADGTTVSQSDGIPAGWTRPTTGWVAGEFVNDVHTVTVPQDAPGGTYQIRVGMYRPGSTRLLSTRLQDAIRLSDVRVSAS